MHIELWQIYNYSLNPLEDPSINSTKGPNIWDHIQHRNCLNRLNLYSDILVLLWAVLGPPGLLGWQSWRCLVDCVAQGNLDISYLNGLVYTSPMEDNMIMI